MLIIAKGRPIEIKCYFATATDGNDNLTADEIRASLAGTAAILGADYITVERDADDEIFYRLRWTKWYTLKKFNPCAYAMRLRLAERKIRLNDILAIDTYPANDNTGLPAGDMVRIRLTIRESPTGQITWAEDVTVPGTLECIRINGGSYYMEDRVITLPDYPSALSDLQGDSTHRTVTDEDKSRWNAVLDKVTPAASSSNQLADKAWVSAQVRDASATFRGTNTTATTEAELIEWANLLPHDENDYVFWRKDDGTGNIYYSKYKFSAGQWLYEYDITSTSFTAEQWAAINSGITSGKIAEIYALIAQCAPEPEVQGKLDNTPAGAHNRPIYIKETGDTGHGTAQEIDSLDVPGDIHSDRDIHAGGGVAASGIGDLSTGATGGGIGTMSAIEFDPDIPYQKEHDYHADPTGHVKLPAYPENLSELQDDATHRLVTDTEKRDWDHAVQDIDIDGLDEYDPAQSYYRGQVVKITDSEGVMRGYRFKLNCAAGESCIGRTERLTYKTLANPLPLTEAAINSILD